MLPEISPARAYGGETASGGKAAPKIGGTVLGWWRGSKDMAGPGYLMVEVPRLLDTKVALENGDFTLFTLLRLTAPNTDLIVNKIQLVPITTSLPAKSRDVGLVFL
eukprot:g45538.t1